MNFDIHWPNIVIWSCGKKNHNRITELHCHWTGREIAVSDRLDLTATMSRRPLYLHNPFAVCLPFSYFLVNQLHFQRVLMLFAFAKRKFHLRFSDRNYSGQRKKWLKVSRQISYARFRERSDQRVQCGNVRCNGIAKRHRKLLARRKT